jgi:phenylacetate-coenzyme A ligase PaaK-like adenylate-forming protein
MGLDRVGILHPSVLSPFVEASARALQDLGVGYIRMYPIPGVCEYERMFDALERYKITTIMSTPTLTYKLLFELKKVCNGKLPTHLKKILVTGEYFCRDNATNMEKILGDDSSVMPFVYGSSEAATLMYGLPSGNYKPIDEDFIFEIHPICNEPVETDANCQKFTTGRLIVTWLRDGLLPILRYDTGDIFTVWQDEIHGGYIFQFDGRETSSGLDRKTKKAVESAIFGMKLPIYHFDCSIKSNIQEMDVNIIVGNETVADAEAIKKALLIAVQKKYSVGININPSSHPFLNFSQSPKTNKFISC